MDLESNATVWCLVNTRVWHATDAQGTHSEEMTVRSDPGRSTPPAVKSASVSRELMLTLRVVTAQRQGVMGEEREDRSGALSAPQTRSAPAALLELRSVTINAFRDSTRANVAVFSASQRRELLIVGWPRNSKNW